MDQDVYGAYNKQRIESLTTDGEGEFNFKCLNSIDDDDEEEKKIRKCLMASKSEKKITYIFKIKCEKEENY